MGPTHKNMIPTAILDSQEMLKNPNEQNYERVPLILMMCWTFRNYKLKF